MKAKDIDRLVRQNRRIQLDEWKEARRREAAETPEQRKARYLKITNKIREGFGQPPISEDDD